MFFLRAAGGKPASQRMNLSSAYSMGATAAQVNPFAADGSYPATNIVSNALVVDKAGTINITANAVFGSNFGGQTITAYIYKNGSQISSASSAATSATLNPGITGVTVAQGDTIAMYAKLSIANGVSLTATTTFVQIDSQ